MTEKRLKMTGINLARLVQKVVEITLHLGMTSRNIYGKRMLYIYLRERANNSLFTSSESITAHALMV